MIFDSKRLAKLEDNLRQCAVHIANLDNKCKRLEWTILELLPGIRCGKCALKTGKYCPFYNHSFLIPMIVEFNDTDECRYPERYEAAIKARIDALQSTLPEQDIRGELMKERLVIRDWVFECTLSGRLSIVSDEGTPCARIELTETELQQLKDFINTG